MRCANCQQDINVGAAQCPFCRHNPYYSAQFDRGTREDRVHTPSEGETALAIAATGLILIPALPFVGVPLLVIGGIGAVNSVRRYFRKR